MRSSALFLLSLCLITFFLGLGRPAIADADEAFYAESAREMVERGDWLTPHFNYEHRWQKPVLYYWLTAVTYLVFGIGEWAARLWSALSGVGLVLTTYAAGRRFTRREDVGMLAGAIAATSFGYFALARMALPDLPLAFFTTAAVLAALESRWIVAGTAAGLGFLVKGPIAAVLPALVLLPIWWRERRTRPVRLGDAARAAAAFAVVGLPWYVAMTFEHGPAYLQSFFIGDNLERFATDRFNEPRSLLFFVPVLLGGLLPWSALALAATWRSARRLVSGRLALSDTDWRLLLWAAMPFLFFSASVGKQPRYILPVLPPVAIIVARAILRRIEAAGRGDRAARRDLRVGALATAALIAVMALLLVGAREILLTAIPALTWASAIALAAAAALLAHSSRHDRIHRLSIVVPVCAAVVLVAVQFGALGGRRPEPVELMAEAVHAHRQAGEAVGVYHVFVRNLVFYSGLRQQELFTEEQAREFMRSDERVLMVVAAEDLPRLEQLSGRPMTTLAEVPYVNTANLKLRQALRPDAGRDVQRVLLVSNR